MRWIRSLMVALAAVAAVGMASSVRADDEEGTPRIDAALETRSYVDAARREVLGQWAYVIGEVDRFPAQPTPEFADQSNLRKRLLDLRLMMDFNAFAYEADEIDRWRGLVDEAYEAVGQYKDLYEINQSFGLPIDQNEQDRRFNEMLNAVAHFRQADNREKLEKAFGKSEKSPVGLASEDRPRLWRMARIEPSEGLDSAGNAARLGRAVLLGLRADGLLVGDIFDRVQEERFHDVRKALRSILVLSDTFPALSDSVAGVREPLADLVKAYGKANEQIIAYHLAHELGQDQAPFAPGVRAAFDKAQSRARDFDQGGALDAFVAALGAVESQHRR
jgi:hypothetical protein